MNKFELDPAIQEILNIKYAEVLMEKLYKKDLISKREYELIIKNCRERINNCINKKEVLNGK